MTNSVNNTNNWTASLVSKRPICVAPKITGYKFVIKVEWVECGGSQGMTFDVERTMMKDGSVCERSPVMTNRDAMSCIRMLRALGIPNGFDTPDALVEGVNDVVEECMKANLNDDDPGLELLLKLADIPREVGEELMKKYPGEANAQLIKELIKEIMGELGISAQ